MKWLTSIAVASALYTIAQAEDAAHINDPPAELRQGESYTKPVPYEYKWRHHNDYGWRYLNDYEWRSP
jgi:hypothetical protein